MAPSSFWDDDGAAAYLKAGFLGFAGSGKTLTASLLAVAAREILGQTGPIAFFDTESGAAYIKGHMATLSGQKPLIKRARAFDDMMAFGTACIQAGVSVAIIDSITHVWRELCDSYLTQKNESRRAANRPAQKRLEFEDWNVIKPRWAQWTDFYINSPLSLIICGRAGWEYEMERNEETGKKELNKVGIKMKTEGEFGFEPSLLVEMEAQQTLRGGSTVPDISRRATVLKDRFTVLDGKCVEFDSVAFTSPEGLRKAYDGVKRFFGPHLSLLVPGGSNQVDTANKSEFQMDETGEAAAFREKREREILCEEIQADIVATFPGQSALEKQAKVEVLKEAFETGSWTKVESMSVRQLRAGLARLKETLQHRAMPRPSILPPPVPAHEPILSAQQTAPPTPPKPTPARQALDF